MYRDMITLNHFVCNLAKCELQFCIVADGVTYYFYYRQLSSLLFHFGKYKIYDYSILKDEIVLYLIEND